MKSNTIYTQNSAIYKLYIESKAEQKIHCPPMAHHRYHICFLSFFYMPGQTPLYAFFHLMHLLHYYHTTDK